MSEISSKQMLAPSPDSFRMDGPPNTASWHVRDEVAEFAIAMEAKLRKNDHKTSWRDQPIDAHIKLLRIEMMELDVALNHLGDEEAMRECLDIGNFAMIIRDKLKTKIANKTNKMAILTGPRPPDDTCDLLTGERL